MWAWRSQRQPCAATSCPSATACSRDPGRVGERAAAGVERRLDAVAREQLPDARPAGAGAVFEMALHAEIAHALDLLDDLVDVSLRSSPATRLQLGPFLDVDDDREASRAPFGQRTAAGLRHAAEITIGSVAASCRSPLRSRPAGASRPAGREMTRATMASRISPVEIAAIVGSDSLRRTAASGSARSWSRRR